MNCSSQNDFCETILVERSCLGETVSLERFFVGVCSKRLPRLGERKIWRIPVQILRLLLFLLANVYYLFGSYAFLLDRS